MLASLLQLGKFRISLLSGFSAIAGYVMAGRGIDSGLVAVAVGVVLMAAGSSALNQVQERFFDARMERTRHRPLPAGRLSVYQAVVFAALALAGGALTLGLATGPLPALLGVLAALLYNGIYTPLKRRTAFAVLPGAVIGALPPAMGWLAAGGSLADAGIQSLMLFLFVWQIPHFWLLVLRYGRDYERAGFPTVTRHFGTGGTVRITALWVLATGVAGLLVPILGAFAESWSQWLLAGAVLVLAGLAVWLLGPRGRLQLKSRVVFVALNSFALIVLVLLVAHGLTGQI